MKTRSWLYTSAAVMLGGLAALAFFGVYAINDIRGIISQLTERSTPLQIKTTELQRTIESLSGILLRLGVATDKREVAELSSAVEDRMKTLGSSLEAIKALDAAKAGTIDLSAINNLYADVKQATDGRIESLGNFQAESRKVNEAILSVDRSLEGVRSDMQVMTGKGSAMVSTSIESSSQVVKAVQQINQLVVALKEMQIILKDLDAAKTQTEIFANKSKIKNANAAIQALQSKDPIVIAVKRSVDGVYQQFVKPETGMFALKQALLAGKDTGSKFAEGKREVNNHLLEMVPDLNAAAGRMDLKMESNRREVESATSSSRRIGGIDAAVSIVAVDVKTLDAKVRSLMLSESVTDAAAAAAGIRAVFSRIELKTAAARRELQQLKQGAALKNLDTAAASVRVAATSIERIVAAQLRIIASNEKARKAIETVKTAANRELKSGELLLTDTASLQKQMVEKTNSTAARMSTTIALMSALIALLAALPLLYTIRRINHSLTTLTAMVKDIAEGEGDLTKRLDGTGKDEFAELSRWFNVFLAKLNSTLLQVADNTRELTAASAGLQESSRNIATASENVAAQGATAATASEEMAATSADISHNCQAVADNSRAADAAAQSGADVVRETLDAMDLITEKVRKSALTVATLGERGDQIGAIVATIQDIADQTNLVALNAAIEAARAGETGRGFAVVADEVRRLAVRTTEATREIGAMIKGIQDETRSAVVSMEEGVRQVETGSEKAAASGAALQEILRQIAELNLQISQIATAAEQQTATTHEINRSVQKMTDEVSTTAEGARLADRAVVRLSSLSEGLQRLVGQFKLAADGGV